MDYPIFNSPPDTGFECSDKADGMYADVDARCQVRHSNHLIVDESILYRIVIWIVYCC